MKTKLLGVIAACVLALSVKATKADTTVNLDSAQLASGSVIDQVQSSYSHVSGFLGDVQTLAQTFTVGVTGELGTIGVFLNPSIPITLNVLQTSAGVPTSTILATAVATPPGQPNTALTYFNFSSSHVPVSVGQVLAFRPYTTVSSGQVLGIQIAFGSPDPYSRGELYTIYLQGGITDWQTFASAHLIDQGPVGGVDAAFVVSVITTPIPGALPLFATGLGALGLLAWRRKRKVLTN